MEIVKTVSLTISILNLILINMGYYTRHVIKVYKSSDIEKDTKELLDILKEKSSGYFDEDTLRDDNSFDDRNWNGGDGCKWYDFDDDMTNISNAFKDRYIYCWLLGEDDREEEYLFYNGEIVSYQKIWGGWEEHDTNIYNNFFEDDNSHSRTGYGELLNKETYKEIVGDYTTRFY